jgi:GNAT superfamily N-acetyltransferase
VVGDAGPSEVGNWVLSGQATEVTAPGALLDAVYFDVLAPAFLPDELMPAESVRRGVESGSKLVAAILDEDGTPVAAAVGDWWPASRVLLLAYLAVRPGLRGGGHGGALLEHVRDRWLPRLGGRALFAEVEHPAAYSGSGPYGDPVARLRFYARHGGRALDFPYFQPVLNPGGQRVYGLILIVLALADGGDTAPTDLVRGFLTEYFTAAEGSPDAPLLHRLDQPGGIPLLPLDDPARIPRSTA